VAAIATVAATVVSVTATATVAHGATTGATHAMRCTVPGARCGSLTRLLDPASPDAGTINVGFELHPRLDHSKPALEPIVAMEGGPGYATTPSRTWYLDLFAPLRDRHDVLFVDQRGTGFSGAINCRALQSYKGDYNAEVAQCGQQLGAASDVYGSAFAADDLAAVLDALHITAIDLYGDSYGTFLAQTFAVRHAERVRTLVLDSSYPVEGQDPWYRDMNRALRNAFRLACERAPKCTALGGDIIERLRVLANALRAHPLTGWARDADGRRHYMTVDPGLLGYIAGTAAYGYPVYRELDGAARAYLAGGDPAPLLRLAAEQSYWGNAGPVKEYSEGLYVAVECNDYPQLWDLTSPIASRPAQLAASVAALKAQDPNVFDPFTVDDWMSSSWTEFTSCIGYPAPSNFVPPLPEPHTYPNVPTLVLSGDLDSLTSPEGARLVANHFPNSTFVDIHNGIHVMALGDLSRCASDIVVRFVRTTVAGDTSCAAKYNAVRMVEQFPKTLGEVSASNADGRLENVALNTVSDVFFRWYNQLHSDGVGLRGGTFHSAGAAVVRFALHNLRWVQDVTVNGHVTWDRTNGKVTGHLRLQGTNGGRAQLDLAWNEWDTNALASVRGTVNGHIVHASLPAA
jgi:pimeloyl-ACP methyl ester carboxylesterase